MIQPYSDVLHRGQTDEREEGRSIIQQIPDLRTSYQLDIEEVVEKSQITLSAASGGGREVGI